MQLAHENLGLLLIRQIEVDPHGRLDIPDRDRAEQQSATPLAGFHAQDDLVLPASHDVGSNVGVGQSLRPMDFAVCRLRPLTNIR